MLAVERNSIRDDKFELRILGTKPDFFCEEIACFDCGNDSIVITKEERKGKKRDFWRHLKKNIPHSKRR